MDFSDDGIVVEADDEDVALAAAIEHLRRQVSGGLEPWGTSVEEIDGEEVFNIDVVANPPGDTE